MHSIRRSQPDPIEGYRTLVLDDRRRLESVWYDGVGIGVYRRGPIVRPQGQTAVGPGWARLLTHLERRLRRSGYRPEMLPRLMTTGAGELALTVPTRAPHGVHRAAQALSRIALRRCEICLRGPAAPVSVEIPALRETVRLCDWHAARLGDVNSLAQLRSEAWVTVTHGDGALRALLLGARLTPAGIAAALKECADSVPAGLAQGGWIWPDLLAHALQRVPSGTLAGVPAEALLPLLEDEVQAVREAAILALACTQATGADGDGQSADELGSAAGPDAPTAPLDNASPGGSGAPVQDSLDEGTLGQGAAAFTGGADA